MALKKYTRLKYLVSINTEYAESNEGYVGLENVESWSGRKIETNTPKAEGVALSYQKGDVLFGKLRPYLAKCYVAEEDACCSMEFLVMRPKNVVSKYLQYRILSAEFIDKVNMSTYGAKMPRANWSFIGNLKLDVPSMEKQQLIANYLDDRCSKIDTIIAEAKASIEEYKELKQAVIYEAVTKGLDNRGCLKDTGIDWIGSIPEKWEVMGFTKCIDKIIDYRGKTPEKQHDGVLLITARNIKEGKIDYNISQEFVREEEFEEIMHRGKVHIGDVLFTTEAPLGQVANADRTDFALAQRIIKFSCKSDVMDNYYLKYWILSAGFQDNLKTFATGSTATGIKASKLGMLKVVVPSLDEQREIVCMLDRKVPRLNSMISEKQSLIEDLEAYKKSLIYEVVTGKRKVVA